MELTLCSYNTHGCVGRDGIQDPERVLAVIQQINAHVIALQEVLSRLDGCDFLAELREATGMHLVPGPTLSRGGCRYGNVLLSRLPVRAVRRLDLSLLGREPRGALDVDLDCDGVRFQVIATHLGLHPVERRFQIRRLLSEVATEGPHPIALLGDINEWFAWGRPLRWLHAHFGKPAAPRTFPAGLPLFALDRVWMQPRECLLAVRAHRSRLARAASDHLPMVARVRVVPADEHA